jgi:hypothetical protein
VTPSDAQVFAASAPLLSLIIAALITWLVRRADRKDADAKAERERQDAAVLGQRDQERHDRDKSDALLLAAQTEARIESRAREIADTVKLQAQVKHLEDELTHAETLARIEETHATAHAAVAQAKEAFHEANGVKLLLVDSNKAIADTNSAVATMQQTLETTLGQLPSAIAAAAGAPTAPPATAPVTPSGTVAGQVAPPA